MGFREERSTTLEKIFKIRSSAYIFVRGEQNITSKKGVAKERLTLPVAKK